MFGGVYSRQPAFAARARTRLNTKQLSLRTTTTTTTLTDRTVLQRSISFGE